jgi:hypothetical protein
MALSPIHGLIDPTVSGVHVPYQWTYANLAARLAATGFIASDVGKLAFQTDTKQLWILTATSPTWLAVGPTEDGWIPAGVTWTYSSADAPIYVFTISGDYSTILTPGVRLKLTDSGTKYFIVMKVSFGAGTTTVSIYGGGTAASPANTLTSGAITNPFYSRKKSPGGFPASRLTWTNTIMSFASSTQQATPTQNQWYNVGGAASTGNIPLGTWRVILQWKFQVGTLANKSECSQYNTLSTANNSESDTGFSGGAREAGASASADIFIAHTIRVWKILTLASKTAYFMNFRTKAASTDINNLGWRGDETPATTIAECPYL